MPTPLPGLGGRQASRQVNRLAGWLPGQSKRLPQPAHHHSDLCRRCWQQQHYLLAAAGQQHIQGIIHAHVPTVVPFKSSALSYCVGFFCTPKVCFSIRPLTAFHQSTSPVRSTAPNTSRNALPKRMFQHYATCIASLSPSTPSIRKPSTIHGLMRVRIIMLAYAGNPKKKSVIISLRYLGR